MTTHLIIRLPEHIDQPVHWQLWPTQDGTTQSYGSISSVDELPKLAEQFRSYTVITLVPASLINLHKLTVTGKMTPAVLQSLPWRLEEELSEDVESFHFTVVAKQIMAEQDSDENESLLHVAAVADRHMQLWKTWLDQAGIISKKWLPDALTLPVKKDSYSLLSIDETVLIKQESESFGACDVSWLDMYLESLPSEAGASFFEALNPIDNSRVIQPSGNPQPPLSFLAPCATSSDVNLLQGKWKQTSPWLQKLRPWRSVAALLLTTVIIAGAQSLYNSIQLEQQASALQKESNNVYRQLFPGERIQVVHTQMRQKLKALQSSSDTHNGLLDSMTALQPLFTAFPDLKPMRLDYQSSNNTLRIEATAKDFDTFTRFRNQSADVVKSDYSISVDALERNGRDSVTGTLIITGKAA